MYLVNSDDGATRPFFLRCTKRKNKAPRRARNANPPTTPPAIAPVLDFLDVEESVEDFEFVGRVDESTEEEDVKVTGPLRVGDGAVVVPFDSAKKTIVRQYVYQAIYLAWRLTRKLERRV